MCSSITAMLIALGPRLQRLSLIEEQPFGQYACLGDLVPAIIIHCPLLACLELGHLGLGKAAAVSVMASVHHCWTSYHANISRPQAL
jgi:hypothetical protein